jgi:ribosomal 30S subunit maturation factor RimM
MTYFLIGEIKAVFDDDGFVSIESFSDFYDRFIELEFVFVKIYGVIKKFFIE